MGRKKAGLLGFSLIAEEDKISGCCYLIERKVKLATQFFFSDSLLETKNGIYQE